MNGLQNIFRSLPSILVHPFLLVQLQTSVQYFPPTVSELVFVDSGSFQISVDSPH